jgi:ATP-dependent DNA helicase DinG
VVAILDRRVVRRGYGRLLLAALPPAKRVRDLGELRMFWQSLGQEVVPERSTESRLPVRHTT